MWSEPHFYNADPQYLHIVHGLEPNRSLHESTVVVEPVNTQFSLKLPPPLVSAPGAVEYTRSIYWPAVIKGT